MSISRDIAAFLTAAIVAAGTVPLTVLAYVASIEGLPNGASLGGAFIYFAVAFIILSVAGLIVGLPIVWALRRISLLNFPVLGAAGLISGAAVSWLILPTFPPFVGAVAGLAAASTWWLIAERKILSDA